MKTKNITKITILLSVLLLMFSSCEEFLQEEPKNFINPETFYSNQKDAESGLDGIYAIYRQQGLFIGQSLAFVNHMLSDYTYPWTFVGFEADYNFPSNMNQMKWIWGANYDGIKRATSYIDILENKDVNYPESIKNRYVAEAKFIRAMDYYYLVQCFGDVPLITKTYTTSDDFLVERDPANEVWEFVKQELVEAITALPSKSAYSGADISRANKEAAKMMLAKIYMIEKNWAQAKTLVDEIIASEEYDLEVDIRDNWREANEHGIESIFEIDFAQGMSPKMGNNLFNLSGPGGLKHPITGAKVGGTWTGLAYDKFFYQSFDDQDERKLKLFFDINTHSGPEGRYFTNKYFDPEVMSSGGWLNNPVNFVVFRYADVLLMKAEIENEVNGSPNNAAYEAINEVRARANISPLPQNMDYNTFVDAVFEERAHELFCEAHRYFDLKRRGVDYLKKIIEPSRARLFDWLDINLTVSITEDDLVLPLPLIELDANPNLTQNPGYE